MVKRKNKTKRVNKIGWINTFLPLDSKMKIQSLINHLKTSHVTFTSQMDIAICNSITDDRLRFYYDTIRPPIVIFNTPKTGRKKVKAGLILTLLPKMDWKQMTQLRRRHIMTIFLEGSYL